MINTTTKEHTRGWSLGRGDLHARRKDAEEVRDRGSVPQQHMVLSILPFRDAFRLAHSLNDIHMLDGGVAVSFDDLVLV